MQLIFILQAFFLYFVVKCEVPIRKNCVGGDISDFEDKQKDCEISKEVKSETFKSKYNNKEADSLNKIQENQLNTKSIKIVIAKAIEAALEDDESSERDNNNNDLNHDLKSRRSLRKDNVTNDSLSDFNSLELEDDSYDHNNQNGINMAKGSTSQIDNDFNKSNHTDANKHYSKISTESDDYNEVIGPDKEKQDEIKVDTKIPNHTKEIGLLGDHKDLISRTKDESSTSYLYKPNEYLKTNSGIYSVIGAPNQDKEIIQINASKNDTIQAEATVTEYIETFTSSVTTHSTATPTTTRLPPFRKIWMYQAFKSSEESDEAKTTLIDYPYSVSLQRKGAHYATGALLSKKWIITVAGEFYNVRESLKLFRARLGSVDCKRGGILVPLKKIEIHPYYLPGKPNFDVALLRTATAIEFNNFIRPIVISDIMGKVVSAKFMITYWPRILVKGATLPRSATERIKYNSMRVSTQRLVPSHDCTAMLKRGGEELHEASLCLKPMVSHHSVCMPDVGAPVIAEDGLWGITSGWVFPQCPKVTAPTIFTRLSSSSVRSWLDGLLLSD